jgi:hypothetical protein
MLYEENVIPNWYISARYVRLIIIKAGWLSGGEGVFHHLRMLGVLAQREIDSN